MVIKPTRNNAQHQPLTTVLRNIVREYPAGGGVLRELCQNADDSGATAIEFILDPAYHPTEPLLHPGGGLAEFQGPALLAYNNRTFSERDFRSLSKIGDSEKLHDLNSTGKFGRGFNSVYNWTDNPSIISGSALLILDPHETWSRDVGEPGGPLWDFVENHQEPEMANQLAPFRCLINDFSRPYEGTIIRLPLRTAEQAARSEIVRDLERKSTGFEDIKEVFESFSTEMVEYLLFLRHISSIRLKIGNEVFAEAVARKFSLEGDITDSFTIDDAYRRVLVQGLEESRVHQFVMAITFHKDGETSTARYAVTHQMRRSHPDGELHEWSRSYKLFPWAAVACPISEGLLQNFSGKLFSTLPLPIRSQHPAHIHAMFSITPDRASIHRDEDSTVSERTETKRGSRWNRWIFEDLVVSAWTANLQFISHLTDRNDCPFAGWNVWPLGGKEQGSLGVGILEGIFERIVTGELRLLPTIGKSLARPSHSLFATQLATSLEEALREATVAVVFPPNDRREQLCQISRRYPLRFMAPTSIREVLSALEPFSEPMSNSSRSVLLDYILSDNDYEEIGDCCARLLPMLDGTFEAFQHRSGCIEVRFARSQEELELFDQCNSWVIDNTKLSSDSLDHFKYQMALLERFTRVSRWDLEGAAFYCGSWVFPEEKKRCKGHFVDTIVRPELLEWVNRFWKWAVALDRKGAMLAFENLWMLPLTGNRLLKLPPTTITLDVSGSGQVAQLFRKILAYSSTVASDYYIYTTNETMSRTNTDFFREAKFIYDCEKLENLVLWLDSCPELLNFASHEQRTQLVDLMGILAVRHIAQETKTRLGKLLKGLPLFHPAFNREEKRPWISLNGLANYVAISTKDGLPAFQHAGAIETIFVDKDCRGALSLLNAFSLCKTPSKAELLQQYVLPSLEKSTGKTKAALSQYILHWQNLMELSHDGSAIERLASMKFVPVRGSESMLKSPPELVDPSTVVEGLYFLDEHPFPRADFLQNFRGGLTTLGMITRITNAVVLERLKKYSRCPDQFDGISHRLQLMLNERPIPPLLGSEYRELKWIPASMDGKEGLFSASECRDHSRKNLVKYVMPLTKLEIGPRWATELGWFKPPSLHIVLEQLRMAILNMDNSVIVSLLDAGWLKDESVQSVLEQMAWIPGISGGYYHRSDIFFHNAEFHPYLDVLSPLVGDFFPEGRATSLCFTLEKEPSLRKLAEVQGKLASRKGLSKKNLAVYVSLLNSAAERFKDADFSTWKFPDADGVMHDCCEMTVGAPPRDGGQDAITKALHFLHPSIPQTTIDLLQFPTVQDRFLEKRVGPEFIQDFEQGQELTAIISDSLQRYPIQDTFNEYLANAEDSGGAEKITWVVDATTKYPKVNLITNKLEECTGEALLCHNDGCFSQKDLDSLTDIGNSSKRDEVSKIGRFGRGSLTMYHWTCTPSFITGEHFVIIDPEQKRLPNNPTTRKPRKGMLLSIRDVRQLWPDQLRPFEGLFGFTSETDEYKGTIFRFPIMKSRATSKMYSSIPKAITIDTVREFLMKYRQDASVALLFLKNVKSIECYERTAPRNLSILWSERAEKSISGQSLTSAAKTLVKVRHEEHEYRKDFFFGRPSAHKRESSDEWLVLTSTVDPSSIPTHLQAARKRHKLQARCGIATLLKGVIDCGKGRLFLDVPTANTIDLPVHISADLVIQSDRRHFIDMDGSDWNNWMMESQLAALYVRMLSCLASEASVSVYNYWPKYPKKTNEQKISHVLKAAIWKRILSDDVQLFRVEGPNTGEDSEKTVEYTSAQHALFNLMVDDHIVHSILPKLDVAPRKLVKPVGEALKGLSAIQEERSINVVSPCIVAQLFKSELNCKVLELMLWEDTIYNIRLINELLKYIISGVEPQGMIGCRLLPLGNGRLGRISPNSYANYFLIDTTRPQDSALPGLLGDMTVISGLDAKTQTALQQGSTLNICQFSFQNLPRVLQRLEDMNTTAKIKRNFFVKVWETYYKLGTKEDFGTLEKLPIVAARSESLTEYEFLTVDDFKAYKRPAILSDPCMPGSRMFNLLQKHGLLIIDRQTFPKWSFANEWVRDEGVETHGGLYRLLRCIEMLAQQNGRSIEMFIRTLFGKDLELFEKLGNLIWFANLTSFNNQQADRAKMILRKLPLIPSIKGNDGAMPYLSPETALLAPSAHIKLDKVKRVQRFVSNTWASSHSRELGFLEIKPISAENLLIQDFFVRLGSTLSADLLEPYFQLLNSHGTFELMSRLPVALDGNLKFSMANMLYDHRSALFQAAFHHREVTSFLHPKLRNLDWTRTTLVRHVSSDEIYLSCARGIEDQSKLSLNNDLLLGRASRVFDFLRWETPELRRICGNFQTNMWRSVPFVPAQYSDRNDTLRDSTMRDNVPKNRLISLFSGVLPEYVDICWSQKPFFREAPCKTVLSLLPPGYGRPTAETVISHLQFLSQKRRQIASAEFPSFIASAKACYRYLQNLGQRLDIPEDHEIWFNTDEESPSREVFNNSWVSTMNLCLGLEYDSRNLQYARSSLQTFVALLQNCNVRTIRGPIARPPPVPRNGDMPYSAVLLAQFQLFRVEQKFVDVHIHIGGEKMGVHKVVLCAASEYFQTMFSIPMREEAEHIIDWNDSGFTALTAERLIHWIYTGEMKAIAASDPTSEMEQLLELMGAANCYLLQDLKEWAAYSLYSVRYIRPETVRAVKKYALECDAKVLVEGCETYVKENLDIVERESPEAL